MSVAAAPASARRDPGPLLWGVTGVAWVATVVLMLVPAVMGTMPAMAATHLALDVPGSSLPRLLAVFAGGWVVMVAAMMLPTTIPMARLFVSATANAPSPRGALAAFSAAYLAVWLTAGLVGLVLAALVTRVTPTAAGGYVVAGALAVAGVFQFSPLKRRYLTLCRDPRAFLFTHYRRGVRAAWWLGVRHGISCLGCCWALMVVMFAVGSSGLAWMLGLTVVMVAEKTAPWGRRLVAPVGAVLLVAALVIAGFTVLTPAAPASGPPAAPMSTHHNM